MSTIIPYFDPILGKLRNSDVALISVASLIVSDPLIVNNLQVLSNASVNQLHTNSIYNVSTISTNGLGLNYAQWNSNTSLGPLEGLMNWSSLYGTIQLGLAGGNVDVPLGLTTNLPKRVRNSTGSTMPKGTAVYLNGVSGNTPLVERALATGDRTSAFTIGMTAEDIANNATGWVTSFGLIRGIDTSSFTSGDTLYLSGATAGYYTNVPTKTPVHYVRVGTVTKASADGEIIVNVINGYELDELHNVVISSLASGQILQSGASSYWYNRSLASAIAENISFLSLGSLAVMNQLSFTSLTNQPSLSSLAFQATIDYTSTQLLNKPSLGSLAEINALSYGSILNLPSLGSLAQMNALSFTSLLNQPSLSSLAFQAIIDYTSNQLTNKPSLGSLAQMNALSFSSLLNQPSLSSLAFQATIDYNSAQLTNKPSLGSLAAMNQLSFTSLTNQPSLASLAFLSAISQIHLPSSASFAILTTQGIVNASTISTNRLNANQIFASTISMGVITGGGAVFASTASIRTIRGFTATFSDVISALNLSGGNTGDQMMPFWGDGADGVVSLDGLTDSLMYPFVTYNAATSTYTQTRDIYASTFYVAGGYTLISAGYRIFAQTQITIDGTLHNNGGNANGATAGTGALGGFFRAGGNGATGLGTAASGAGTVPALPATNTFIGNVGGRGASARSANNAQVGVNFSLASLPGPLFGGKQLLGNYYTYVEPTVQANASTSLLPTYSVGGGAGAKSAVGTTATSGGGGGGGGVVFLSSPNVFNFGSLSATGGNGGNAAGTGGIFGGGGGGAGGYIVALYGTNSGSNIGFTNVAGGTGGSSAGNANTLAVGRSDGTAFLSTVTTSVFTFSPPQAINYNSYYIMSIHLTFTAGAPIGFNAGTVNGMGLSFTQLADVRFNSIANPTRALFVFKAVPGSTTYDQLQDRIRITPVGPVNSVRIIWDEIQNTFMAEGIDPSGTSTTNSSDSATTAVTNLGFTPTTNNMQYTVIATSGGTAFVGGTGVTLLNTSGTTAPIMQSGVAISRASSSITWTTAAAYGAFTIDLNQPTVQESGRDGFTGRVITFNA